MKLLIRICVLIVAAIFLVSCATTYTGKKVKYIELRQRGCYVCQRMDAVTDEIVAKYSNDVDFASYSDSLEEGAGLIKKYHITKFPSNLLFDSKGNLFFRYDGILDFRAIEEQLLIKGVGAKAETATPAAAK